MRRHFTATGFVVDGDRTLLHWHKRHQQWMPPGGHIEPDEDPVQAVLREVREETGLAAEVIPIASDLPFSTPGQMQPPYTILIEDIPGPEEPHQHIDLVYFCRAVDGAGHDPALGDFHWIGEQALRGNEPIAIAACGVAVPLAEDVRLLALKAIEAARAMGNQKDERGQGDQPLSDFQSPVSDRGKDG
jgi:8-oxo-dGTP pyrophosphatase MutT (NUDIX family)